MSDYILNVLDKKDKNSKDNTLKAEKIINSMESAIPRLGRGLKGNNKEINL
jgi:hypothetical protein